MATKKKSTKTKLSPKTDLVLGWHFLNQGRTLGEGDGRRVELGKTLTMKNNGSARPVTCSTGMHASPRITAAAGYHKGPVLCRVEVWGDVNGIHPGTNKFCGRHRRVIWWKELSKADIVRLKGGPSSGYNTSDSLDSLLQVVSGIQESDLETWAKSHGWDDKANAKSPTGSNVVILDTFVKPAIDEKTFISLLSPRVVRTANEIKKTLGSAFDMTDWDDLVDNVSYDNKVIVVVNFTRDGADGYLVRASR